MTSGCQGFNVIDVKHLGQEAMIVNTSGPKLLLLDADLTCERRMQIMSYLMKKYAA